MTATDVPARRGRRLASTKSDIVAAAADLFAERGFAAVGVHEIAERAGISAGAIYRHFAGKDAVLQAVLLDAIDAWLAVANGRASSLRDVIEGSVQLVLDRPGPLATYVRERHLAGGDIRRQLARREAELFERWSDAIVGARPGLSRGELAVRQQAVNGVLSSLAGRPGDLASPRLRVLVVEGLLAIVTSKTAAATPAPPPRRRAWHAPTPRREQIIATAMRLFAARGYHGVGMDDIGDAVGMSGPSLYEHVAGKVDILLDAYDRAGAFVIAGAARAVVSAASPGEALDGLIRSYVEVAFDHVDLLVVTSREGGSLPASERPRLARRRRDLHEQWAGVLRELRPDLAPADARILVRSALALVNALARQRRQASPSIEAAVLIGRAFLLHPAEEQP